MPSHRPDDGPAYPWGSQPWPGTADDPTKDSAYTYNDADFQTAFKRLVSVRTALGSPPAAGSAPAPSSNSKTPADHLNAAGNLKPTDFGTPVAGARLHGDIQVANSLMVGAYTNFLKAFDGVIDKLQNTAKTNTGVEADNVQAIDMIVVDTIKPGDPALPTTAPGAPNNPGT